MKSYNKVTLIGRVGQDLEVKAPQNGSVVNFSIATTEKVGKEKEVTDWHNIVAWNGLATIAGNFLKKGTLVLIEGSLRNDNYEKAETRSYNYKIIADKLVVLTDGKEKAENS